MPLGSWFGLSPLRADSGVQTKIPARKLTNYFNVGIPTTRDAVPEALQGAYYKRAVQLAYCQPTVAGLLFFHVSDEPDLERWQSGLFYADDTPKKDLNLVRAVAQAAQAGTLTCPKVKPTQRAKLKSRPQSRR